MSVKKGEKTSRNRRLKENRQLQSQMIVHGVKGTFEAVVGGPVDNRGALRGSVPVTVADLTPLSGCGWVVEWASRWW